MMQTPFDMLNEYVRAFETMRASEVTPFYDLPCTFIRPDGVWIVQDEATALVLARHLIEHAKAQGYHHTQVCAPTLRELALGLAELSGVFIRYDEWQSEIGRFGFTYIVRSDSEKWKIIVAIAHDAGTRDMPDNAEASVGNERAGA